MIFLRKCAVPLQAFVSNKYSFLFNHQKATVSELSSCITVLQLRPLVTRHITHFSCEQGSLEANKPLSPRVPCTFSSERKCQFHCTQEIFDTSLITTIYSNKSKFGHQVAVTDNYGNHTYNELLFKSAKLRDEILEKLPVASAEQRHVALLLPNTSVFVMALWAVWMSGYAAIPLCPQHPPSLLNYYLKDSGSSLILCCSTLLHLLPEQQQLPVLVLGDEFRSCTTDQDDAVSIKPKEEVVKLSDRALLLYTSGTTGDPKGVVLTHQILQAQVQCLLKAWEYHHSDVLLNCLPLHHTHGVVNALLAPLSVGARVVMTSFSTDQVWSLLLGPEFQKITDNTLILLDHCKVNFFTAVPTIYVKLLQHYDRMFASSPSNVKFIKELCLQNLRLMISGSAALPVSVLHRWQEVTGHTLLERYGMTEIGMALTNPLHGVRKPGYVGNPFPGVFVRIVDAEKYESTSTEPAYSLGNESGLNEDSAVLCIGDEFHTSVARQCENMGELQVKGPSVFKEYWNKPEATKKEFTADGWFRTGDTAMYDDGSYKILGRTSVDIIKSGGYKVSALAVERALLEHPNVEDVAVVGVPDETWGQRITAVLVWAGDCDEAVIKHWLRERLPPYQVPSRFVFVDALPRNTMGKVNKKELLKRNSLR